VCAWERQSLGKEQDLNHEGHPSTSLRAGSGSQRKPAYTAMIPVHQTPTGVSFSIKVHPRAKRNAITGELGDALKVSLIAPPADGRANDACIEFFANLLNVPRSSVTIASGETSRIKVIRIAGMSSDELRRRIGT
jgi:uncharacterized protein